MITYNICFIKQGGSLLLLNRESPSWMGCWNGVGGKLEKNESPRRSMVREIAEETNIHESAYHLSYKGLVSWTEDGDHFGGMYLYTADFPEDVEYTTPVKTSEGILDWKPIEWVLVPENQGIATNLPVIIKHLFEESPYHHHCAYIGGKLSSVSTETIEAATEDGERMLQYVKAFQALQLSS
ncbi:NUDIX hydrolase [Paenibacillus piri]|uniref:8-oxo-dGTP diphosphatase n=1 Tax=Paenibacillus piri TaxID=2547395 RepID=A0A4V2ZT69_9BACL|nr:8-oxo-dGTP diphosphatase [Paenibacillus piri]TDF95934.1 8-oxo-dGTP diphosphatase [Paenibacillus piri]